MHCNLQRRKHLESNLKLDSLQKKNNLIVYVKKKMKSVEHNRTQHKEYSSNIRMVTPHPVAFAECYRLACSCASDSIGSQLCKYHFSVNWILSEHFPKVKYPRIKTTFVQAISKKKISNVSIQNVPETCLTVRIFCSNLPPDKIETVKGLRRLCSHMKTLKSFNLQFKFRIVFGCENYIFLQFLKLTV